MPECLLNAAKLLGIDAEEELARVAQDPNGGRAVELARQFRDHPEGGVDKVLECVKAIALMVGFTPHEDEVLRTNLLAL